VRVALRTAIAFIIAMLTVAPRALFLTPTPAPITRRVVSRMIIFTSVWTALTLPPFFYELWSVPSADLAWLFILLLPSIIVVVLPFALGFVVDGIRRNEQPTPSERVAALRTALIGVVFTLILGGWIMPETNQQFRLAGGHLLQPGVARGMPLPRGARELTMSQLVLSPHHARAEGPRWPVKTQRELHSRASLILLPVILIWMRWRALAPPSPRWRLPAWLTAAAAIVTYFIVRSHDVALEHALRLSPGAGAWIPLAVFATIALARGYIAKRRWTAREVAA
jgi:hypothetical protein